MVWAALLHLEHPYFESAERNLKYFKPFWSQICCVVSESLFSVSGQDDTKRIKKQDGTFLTRSSVILS